MADLKTQKPQSPLKTALDSQSGGSWNRNTALKSIEMGKFGNGNHHTIALKVTGKDGKVDIDLPNGSNVKMACMELQKAFGEQNPIFKIPTKNYSPIHWLTGRLVKLNLAGWNIEFVYDGKKIESVGQFKRDLSPQKA